MLLCLAEGGGGRKEIGFYDADTVTVASGWEMHRNKTSKTSSPEKREKSTMYMEKRSNMLCNGKLVPNKCYWQMTSSFPTQLQRWPKKKKRKIKAWARNAKIQNLNHFSFPNCYQTWSAKYCRLLGYIDLLINYACLQHIQFRQLYLNSQDTH